MVREATVEEIWETAHAVAERTAFNLYFDEPDYVRLRKESRRLWRFAANLRAPPELSPLEIEKKLGTGLRDLGVSKRQLAARAKVDQDELLEFAKSVGVNIQVNSVKETNKKISFVSPDTTKQGLKRLLYLSIVASLVNVKARLEAGAKPESATRR
jgi:hypothetical protein